jgi:hypothetical protein
MAKRRDQKHKRGGRTTVRDSRQKLSGQSGPSLKLRRYTIWTTSALLAVVVVVGAWMVMREKPPVKLATSTMEPSETVLPPDTAKAISRDSVSGSPQISFPETEYNFGTIAQGAKVSHTFVVRNVGDAPLRLIKAAGT